MNEGKGAGVWPSLVVLCTRSPLGLSTFPVEWASYSIWESKETEAIIMGRGGASGLSGWTEGWERVEGSDGSHLVTTGPQPRVTWGGWPAPHQSGPYLPYPGGFIDAQ
jgi:hypothetical protein